MRKIILDVDTGSDDAVAVITAGLSDKIDWLGYATREIIYGDGEKNQKMPVGTQIQFAGVFPAGNPRYTICLVADKHSTDVTPSVFQSIVNPLASWLLR